MMLQRALFAGRSMHMQRALAASLCTPSPLP
jgi:hypothetical protein